MLGPFSQYLDAVGRELPLEVRRHLRGELYVTVLHFYTDGIKPQEAASRILHTVARS